MSEPIPMWYDSEDRDRGEEPNYYLCPAGTHPEFEYCRGYGVCTGVDDDE